jgi:hypothetical protein
LEVRRTRVSARSPTKVLRTPLPAAPLARAGTPGDLAGPGAVVDRLADAGNNLRLARGMGSQARALMRRLPHKGQNPCALHENAMTISSAQREQSTWTHPCSSRPHRR